MDKSVALRIARRFITLPLDKRKTYLEKMLAEGVSPANLPLPEVKSGFDAIALSYAQERQWFLWQMDPHSTAYHIPNALRLKGELDVPALERSFNALAERHDSLRTTFAEQGDSTVQVIHPHMPVRIDVQALDRDYDPALLGERIKAFIEQQIHRPFDLRQGPLLRVALLKIAEDDHVLALIQHHIISDGWSMQVMIKELIQQYVARTSGQPLTLPELTVQYADYAIWQRHWLEAGERERQLAYWMATLGDANTVLELPIDNPRPAVQSFRGARLDLTVPPALATSLKQLAQQQEASVFMVLLASFQALLHRYSGQREIRVGVPVANRNRVETEGLIGFFVNTQVLNAQIDGQLPFTELLAQVKQSAMAAQAHQDLPFEQLIEALQPERSLSHSPVFQVMYNHQALNDRTQQQRRVQLPQLSVENLVWEGRTAQYDLTLGTYESSDGLSAELTYATDLFTSATIERLARHWQNLLQGIVAEPSRRIGELPLLDSTEHSALLRDWHRVGELAASAPCVHQRIALQAANTPDAIALTVNDQALTYGELDARANRLAHKLIEAGVGPERRVGIAVERSVEMIVGLLAILKAGGAYVPLDPAYPEDRLAYMIQDSSLTLLLTQSHVQAQLPIPPGLESLLLDQPSAWLAAYPRTCPTVALTGEHLAYVIYTSGSTGKPKGVMVRHGALSNFVDSMVDQPGLNAQDRMLSLTTFSFDIFGLEIYGPLLAGARVVLTGKDVHQDPQAVLELIERHGVTVVQATPSTWRMLLDHEQASTLSGRTFLCGGEALPQELAQRMLALSPQVWNLYGPTETTIWSALHPLTPEQPRPYLGKPIDNTALYILGSDLELNPLGAPGELLIGGAGLARGYFERPALTAERFVPDPFSPHGGRLYRTGDLARYRAEGVIEYIGRIDHQVKIRGFRIELGEIEARLLALDSVRETVVVAQDGPTGAQLVGYVVPSAPVDAHGETALRAALKASLKSELPEYMVPAHLMFLGQLPLTPNGKVDRKALPSPDASLLQSTYVAPQTATQHKVAEIWQAVLKLEQVGLSDNFFELGGHSLLVTQVISRVRQALNIQVPLRTLFEHGTLEAFVDALGVEQTQVEPALVAVPRQALMPLSYAQERQWFLWQLEPTSSAYHVPAALRLRGCLDLPALQDSFNALISRHESLRTRFVQHGEQTWQQIDAPSALTLSVETLERDLDEDRLETLIAEETQALFDLQQSPLLRVKLLRLAVDDHVLVLSLHHIISDGWSMQVMIDELIEHYAGYSTGQPRQIAPLAVQYADYAVWQRQWMEAGERERQLSYWTAQLGGDQPLLELPTDRPRPAQQSYRGARQDIPLSAELTVALKHVAQRENVTLFALLLAAFQTLLHRYSGQVDIRVGVPVANRNRLETEGLIGFFVNTQVLKVDIDSQQTFRSLLTQVKHRVLGAQAHQDLPFEQLVDALQPQRNLSHSPLFQVMHNHQSQAREGRGAARLPQLGIEGLTWASHTSKFDLTLDTFESADNVWAELTYATDLFDAATMVRMAEHWTHLLHGIVADCGQRIAELPLQDTAERAATLLQWNPVVADFPSQRCLHELIEAQALRAPEAIAVSYVDQALSYGELNACANQLAHRLIACGVGPDVRVGLAVDRSLEMLVGLLAILKAGGAYVPLDPTYPEDRLSYMIVDSGIAILLTQSHLLGRLPVPDAVRSLMLDQDCDGLEGYSDANPQVPMSTDNLAYVIYTSGSTGQPKGTFLAHHNVLRLFEATADWFNFGPQDVWSLFHSYAFDFSVWEIFGALLYGGKLVVVPYDVSRSPEDFHALLCRERISVLNQTPSAFKQLMQVACAPQQTAPQLSLRYVVFGGEALEVTSLRPWFERFGDQAPQLINMYGITETTVHVTYRPLTLADLQREAGSPIGEPIPDLSWYLLDGDLNPVAKGCIGELYVGRAGLARGYLNRADLTCLRFIPDPFANDGGRLYRTGDLARYRADGVIEYVGRIDHQVKIRGFRIELGEVEAQLLAQAAISQAVVLAQPGLGGQQLVAYLVPVDPALLEAKSSEQGAWRDQVRAALKEHLPEHMIPAHLLLLAQLPLTANGKLNRNALPAVDASLAQQAYQAPCSELEQRLAHIWQEVLKLPQVGLNDNFFELGGDSIISIQVVSRARQAGIRLSPKDLFQHQTVQRLALVAQVGTSESGIDQQAVSGAALLLPIQQQFFDDEIPERHHWNQSVLLKPRVTLDGEKLEQVLSALVAHHDALRLSFTHQDEGWSAQHQTIEQQQLPLLWQEQAADAAALEALGNRARRSLDLQHGPLLRAVLATLADGSQRLLLVIHHLVVDGVSWRILLEDLQNAYQQLLDGKALSLPAKTSAFKEWSEQLQRYAGSPALQQELAYWQTCLSGVNTDLPCLRTDAGQQNHLRVDVQTRLDPTLTRQLLQQAPAAYRTQVNDLLLTALARVIGRWTGQPSTLIQLEGHGREELFDAVDLTRTVGWFTSLFPVRLTAVGEPGAAIKQTKEQLRAIPDKGIGYGALRYLGNAQTQQALRALPSPRITFNYLGQFDGSFADDDAALFTPAQDNAGLDQSLDAPMANWLTLNGQVYGGELSIGWSFSRERFDIATIEHLAQDYAEELAALIAHCVTPGVHGLTPSDFPLAGLTQAQLDNVPVASQQIADIYPLSPMQQGMLFHSLYEQQSGDYINQMCVDVEGLHVERFREAWQAAVSAHDVLRSSFVWDGEFKRPLQVIHKQAQVPFTYHDWQSMQAPEPALIELAATLRQQGFDLMRAPLLNLTVVQLAAERYHLIYTSHHILMDGWSNSQLLGEVLQRYSGQIPATTAGRYRDYIEYLSRQDAQVTGEFWKGQLTDLQTPTRLAEALMHSHGTAANEGQGEHLLTLDVATTDKLSGFARAQKVTVNTLIQAAWLLLLQRYTGQETVCFGATVSGRPAQLNGVEEQIGLFINTLPVIATPRAEQPLVQWLQHVQAKNLLLREQEHTPLFDIQRWAGQGGEALFDNILVFENYPIAEALQHSAARDLRFGEVARHEQTNYPMTLMVSQDSQLTVHFSYQCSRFTAAAVGKLANHLQCLLRRMTQDAERCLGELGMLDDAEQQLLLGDGHPMPPDHLDTLCTHQLIECQVAAQPDALAVTFANRHLTYAELDAQANRLAHKLIEMGVGPEVRVGVAMQRSERLVVALLAVLKAGGAYVPLDPDYPPDRVAYMLDDSRARVLLTERAVATTLQIGTATRVVLMDEMDPALADYSANAPVTAVTPDNLAYVIYTSGSTGKPKGVAIAHRNVLALIHWSKSVYSDKDIQGVLASTSMCFDLSVWELFVTLANGGSLIIARNALELPHLPARDQVRLINTVPSAINALQDAEQIPAGVRIINLAGEPLKQSLVDKLYRHSTVEHVYDLYGPSEDTTYSTWARREADGVANIGRPLTGTAGFLLGAHLQPAPQGVSAELYLAGAGITRGYLGRAAMTAERFVPNPFARNGERLYRTGDLTRYRADATLQYLGRIDHQVKVRGFRIELGEIESRLLQLPGVREALVVVQPAASSQQLIAYVVCSGAVPGDTPALAVLREAFNARLKQHLPEYMVPAHLLFLEKMPLTPNGKIDRKALPALDASASAEAYSAPADDLERQIAAVWQEVLELDQVGREDHFFALGGHSLLATQAVARLRKLTPVKVSLRDLFNYPRLKDLAVWLRQQDEAVHASMAVPLKAWGVKRTAPLSLVQRRLWIAEQMAGGSAAYGMPMALRLRGELSVERLISSFAEVVKRHEVLRTAYTQDDEGDPIAVIAEQVDLDFPVIDLSALSRSAQEEQVALAALENARTPIDMQHAPLLRGRILHLGPTEHIMLYAMHHIISDGWSMGLLVNELVQIYERTKVGDATPLPELEVQYSDFALWQQALQTQGVLAHQAAYWKGQLGGYGGQLSLPLDKPRGLLPSFEGDAVQFKLTADLTRDLRQRSKNAGVTLYSTLLAGFQVLLHQVSGATDVLVGADVAGREQPELERLIGFFVNVLPLRSHFDANAPFAGFLARTQETLLSAMEHQDLPFDMIVEASDVPRHKGMNPLVQVLFVMNNLPGRTQAMGGLSVESLPALETHSKFDMALFVDEEEGQLLGNWQFATTLFGHERIQYLVKAWIALLEQIVADQDIQLGALSMPVDNLAVAATPAVPGPKADKLGKFLKRSTTTVARARPSPVRESLVAAPQPFPLLLEPNEPHLDLIEWINQHRPLIEQKLAEHAGILFRGFQLDGIEGFEAFAEAIQPGLYGQYGDLPKKEGGKNTYRSTPYPERKMILFHNESAHQDRWPRKQMFYCEQAAPVGGATPVVDCRLMYEKLPAALRDTFEEKGLLYVRTFTDKLDVSWQHFFKTEDRAEVEARCRAGGIEWRWLDNDELQTRTPGPAVICHPVTGAKSFFNQVQLHHTYWLEPDVREDLLSMFGLERMPRQVYYGDGTPIDDEVMQRIGELYEACAVRFDWQKGDAILLDNMLVAHARDPYEGPRKIVVAMGDMFDRSALQGAAPVRVESAMNTEETGA